MRKIELQDAFKLSRLIKKTGIKDTLKDAFKQGKEKDASAEDIGVEVMFAALDASADTGVENSIYELIADIAEQDVDATKHMGINELKDFFKKLSEENDIEGFMKLVKKSI